MDCKNCGVTKKEGVVWYDEKYCSGKCYQADGGSVSAPLERVKTSGIKVSLEEYRLDYPSNLGRKDSRGQRIKGRLPKRYARRYEPEKLNWGNPLNAPHLKQAGFRANRQPIPGDWDFKVEEAENE